MEGKNAAYIKIYNRRRVLALLRQSPLSRAELSRKIHLTRAAISMITDELMAEGAVQEAAKLPTRGPGRTATALQICKDVFYAIGISLNRSSCQVGIEDLGGGVVAQKTVRLQTPEGLIREIRQLLAAHHIPAEKLLGIGISSPGPVDAQAGVILNPPDFPMWSGCAICDALSQSLGLPAYLENDANAAALYNCMNGDFPEKDNFLLLYLDNGVGSGAIYQGRLLRSCELGHTSIDLNGPACSCGNRGCLELYAAPERLLLEFPVYKTIPALLDSKDAEAALQSEAKYLSAAIINFSNLVPVDAVLLDGQLQDDRLLAMIEDKIRGRTLSGKHIRLLSAITDPGNRIQSACSIVFSRYLDAEQERI